MNEDANRRSATLDCAEIADLLRLLPHRYPFLMIDRIIEMRSDEFGIGVKNVTINEPYFLGHFPGNPVMPGVLQLEGMAQTAGAMCLNARSRAGAEPVVYLMTIDKARFRRPVVPGDTIHYHMTKLRRRFDVWKFRGEAMVGRTLVAEAIVSAMMTDRG
jgi:3-hydroxyacyl-[acyl-carrier-protein] dehydratase